MVDEFATFFAGKSGILILDATSILLARCCSGRFRAAAAANSQMLTRGWWLAAAIDY